MSVAELKRLLEVSLPVELKQSECGCAWLCLHARLPVTGGLQS